MSNVWTSIASKAPCVRRHARPAPLLHLFSGYARSIAQPVSWRTATWTRQTCANAGKRQLSTTASVSAARSKARAGNGQHPQLRTKAPRGRPTSPAYTAPSPEEPTIESPPAAVTHTEGVVDVPEPLTWRDYDPAGGMPLPNGELSQPEINAVFNSEDIDADTGNYVLSVMHWRRLSGALIDVGLDFPTESYVTREMALKGLQYIRQLQPDVDENANGQVWAEEEAQKMQKELEARAQTLHLFKKDREVEEELWDAESEQGTDEGRQRSATSALQQIRKENERKWEQEQKQQAIGEAKKEQSALHSTRGPLELAGQVVPPPPAAYAPAGRGRASLTSAASRESIKQRKEAAIINRESDLPRLTTIPPLQRFGPSALLVLVVLAGCYCLSHFYTPAPDSARMWPEYSPATATMIAITGAQCVALLVSRHPSMWRFASKYMAISPVNPFAISLLGAPFRHQTVRHLFANLVGLWLFGPLLHEDVGRGTFLAIYIASGVCGGFGSLVFHGLKRHWDTWIVGASNCVLGVVAASCMVKPTRTMTVLGYDVPISAWIILVAFSCLEAVAVVRGLKTGIDHVGHLGGVITGSTIGLYCWSKTSKQEQVAQGDKLATHTDAAAR